MCWVAFTDEGLLLEAETLLGESGWYREPRFPEDFREQSPAGVELIVRIFKTSFATRVVQFDDFHPALGRLLLNEPKETKHITGILGSPMLVGNPFLGLRQTKPGSRLADDDATDFLFNQRVGKLPLVGNMLIKRPVEDVPSGLYEPLPAARVFLPEPNPCLNVSHLPPPILVRPAGRNQKLRTIRIGYRDIAGANIHRPGE